MVEQKGRPTAVTLERRTWADMGLDAHAVYLISEHVNPITGSLTEFVTLLDAHWQEATAWQCAERWAGRYGVPIVAYVDLGKVIRSGK